MFPVSSLNNDSVIYDSQRIFTKENQLYDIWSRLLLEKEMFTSTGKSVNIIFPGHPNHYSGPDFLDAKIILNNQVLTGDIEIHLDSKDWYLHNHHKNYEFNNVILHVCLDKNETEDMTLKQNNQTVEILVLSDYLISSEYISIIQNKYCPLFATIQLEWLGYNLSLAGKKYFQKKVSYFETRLLYISLDQLLYQSLLMALGYSRNTEIFEEYAQVYNWEYYKQKIDKGLSLQDFQSCLIANMNNFRWNNFRIRPCNLPQNRLLQISVFLFQALQTSISSEIFKIFSFISDYNSEENDDIDVFLTTLRQRVYQKLCQDKENKPGKSKINLIIVNVFLPIMMLYAKKINNHNLQQLCLDLLISYPALDENHNCKNLYHFMTDIQIKIANNKAITQFGMLFIYKSYCKSHNCSLCTHNNNIFK
jgi:hypothetical protein